MQKLKIKLKKLLKKNKVEICNEYCDLVTIDSIHCINLKKSKDRRQHIKNEEIKINKEINIFEAIDGNILSVKEQNKLHPNKFTIFTHNLKITSFPKTMACATSHMMLLKSLKKNNENVLILEDDNYFRYSTFIKDFENISCNLPKNWDIVFFNPLPSMTRKKRKKFLLDYNNDFYYLRKTSKYNFNYTCFFANCYLINKNSIDKIIEHKITDDIDVLLTKLNLNIYITKECWCTQSDFKTTRW